MAIELLEKFNMFRLIQVCCCHLNMPLSLIKSFSILSSSHKIISSVVQPAKSCALSCPSTGLPLLREFTKGDTLTLLDHSHLQSFPILSKHIVFLCRFYDLNGDHWALDWGNPLIQCVATKVDMAVVYGAALGFGLVMYSEPSLKF